MTIFPDCENLLRERIGLDPASVSPAAVERAVTGRLRARGLDWDGYWKFLRSSEEELRELIEAVIVPETWFFRDREAFALLGRLAANEWPKRDGNPAPARLLSLPCSTGEEPYSMAMALLEAGIAPARFQIDAVDISRRSLALAREGVYGRNSFRGGEVDFRARHFTPVEREWKIGDATRGLVRFREGNLFDPILLAGEAPYDAVFCRNVLIYFDREAQDGAVRVLRRLLAPGGVLFVGPSETSLVSERGFAAVRTPQTFAFRRAEDAPRPPKVAAKPKLLPRLRPPAPPRSAPLPFQSVVPLPAAPAPVPVPTDALGEMRRFADQGQLAEAAALGEDHLRAHGPSAQAYYLLGVVRDALRQHGEAAALYRKALYLDPEHREALAHLGSLLESQGDKGGARLLAERARRLPPPRESE